MIAAIGAAAIVGGRSRVPQALALIVALTLPQLAAVLMALALGAALRRPVGADPEMQFHQMVASELRGGASVRHALASALAAGGNRDLMPIERRLRAGYDIEEAASAIRSVLAHTGRLAEAAIVFGSRSGGRAAPAFQTMAEIAAGELEVRREVAAALAPAWLAVGLVGGAPVFGLAWLAVTGRLADTISTVPGRLSVLVGAMLVAAGVIVVSWLARRALR